MNIKHIILISLVTLLNACNYLKPSPPLEAIHVPNLDTSNWEIGFQENRGNGTGNIREWVPKGESINSWSQLLSIEFMEGALESPFQYSENLANKKKQQCPGTQWTELKRDKFTITYKFTFPSCMGHDAQVEVTRMFAGHEGLHRLSYSQKGAEMDKEKQNYYLQYIHKAYLAKGSPDNRVY